MYAVDATRYRNEGTVVQSRHSVHTLQSLTLEVALGRPAIAGCSRCIKSHMASFLKSKGVSLIPVVICAGYVGYVMKDRFAADNEAREEKLVRAYLVALR